MHSFGYNPPPPFPPKKRTHSAVVMGGPFLGGVVWNLNILGFIVLHAKFHNPKTLSSTSRIYQSIQKFLSHIFTPLKFLSPFNFWPPKLTICQLLVLKIYKS
jgi:hypothetical protein